MNNQQQYLSSNIMQNIMKEIKILMNNPLEDIRVMIKNDNIRNIEAIMMGPADTPYSDGEFLIYLHFSNDFPQIPPKGYFITKIFHPNVAFDTGEICLNTLKRDWKPDYGLTKILVAIRSLLIVPNADSALNEEAAKLLLSSYDDYARRAKLFTQIHAKSIGLLNQHKNQNGNNDDDDDDEDYGNDDDDDEDDDNDNSHKNTTNSNNTKHSNEDESKNANNYDSDNKVKKETVDLKTNKTNNDTDFDNNQNDNDENNNGCSNENKEFNNIPKNQNQNQIQKNSDTVLVKTDKKNKQNKMQSKLSKSLRRL